jgi:hypothetical protein
MCFNDGSRERPAPSVTSNETETSPYRNIGCLFGRSQALPVLSAVGPSGLRPYSLTVDLGVVGPFCLVYTLHIS